MEKSRKISLQDHFGIIDLGMVMGKQDHNILGYVFVIDKFNILAKVVGRAKFNFIEDYIWQL